MHPSPFDQNSKFEFSTNLKTGKAFAIDVQATLLASADVSPNVRFAAPKAAILERPAFVPKRRSCRNSTAALFGFANEMGMLPVPRLQGQQLNYRSRLRPVEPSCSRAAGIAARGDAARAGPGARPDRRRAWIVVPRGLLRDQPVAAARRRSSAA